MKPLAMKLLVFAASHRPESYNLKLALLAADIAKAHGAEIDFAEYGEFDMPLYNDAIASKPPLPVGTDIFLKRAQDCAGIIIACPEYNWSFPGTLKNILDWTSRVDINGLRDKTAMMLCASTSQRGGIVGLNQLRSPLEALQVHVYNRAYPLSRAQAAFTSEGKLTDEKLSQQLTGMVSDYVTYTRRLMLHQAE